MVPTLTGRLIRYWRERRGITRSELARRVGVTRPAIAQWETGASSPRDHRLEKIVEELGLTVAGFYGAQNNLPAEAAAE